MRFLQELPVNDDIDQLTETKLPSNNLTCCNNTIPKITKIQKKNLLSLFMTLDDINPENGH